MMELKYSEILKLNKELENHLTPNSYNIIVGSPIEFINAVGASDGRYFSCDDIEIVNFGPGIGSEGHSVNESVEIKKLLEMLVFR